mmetsp:Transcript_125454/g.349141  ORF Transcript_125454/g.349141 Transcript_125454/m.349141 type:complete len:262 (-) Transcript_125454:941-1726(-)
MHVLQSVLLDALSKFGEQDLKAAYDPFGLVLLQEALRHRSAQVGHKRILELSLELLEERRWPHLPERGRGRLAGLEQVVGEACAQREVGFRGAGRRLLLDILPGAAGLLFILSVVRLLVAQATDDPRALHHGGLAHWELCRMLPGLLLRLPLGPRRLLFRLPLRLMLLDQPSLLLLLGPCLCLLAREGLRHLPLPSYLGLPLLLDGLVRLVKPFLDGGQQVGGLLDLLVHLCSHVLGLHQVLAARHRPRRLTIWWKGSPLW